MKEFILAIIAQLELRCPLVHVNEWNNQFAQMETGEQMTFPLPCAFVEIITDSPTVQLGQGVQLYDPLVVRIHIGGEKYNEENYLYRNMDIFDTKQDVYLALQKFEPANASTFVRVSEAQDNDHTNIYHYTIDFATNLMDFSAQEPRNPIILQPPFTIDLTATLE